MSKIKGPVGERNHTTLSWYKKLAKRHGFVPGAKVNFTRVYANNLDVKKVSRTGTVAEWYPYIFTVEWTNGFFESFRYQEICEGELKAIKKGRK